MVESAAARRLSEEMSENDCQIHREIKAQQFKMAQDLERNRRSSKLELGNQQRRLRRRRTTSSPSRRSCCWAARTAARRCCRRPRRNVPS